MTYEDVTLLMTLLTVLPRGCLDTHKTLFCVLMQLVYVTLYAVITSGIGILTA